MSNLQIDPQRLWDSLMDTARVGGLPAGGIARLTLTQDDKTIRDWFRGEVEALGMSVTVDDMGNMFALRAGQDASLPPIAIGSHLDTQPTGGKFDGNLGVLAGLEVMRTLHATGYVTRAPLMLVNWTNEEGARFLPAMLGSGVYAGAYPRSFAYDRTDPEGIRFEDALDGIGYRGASAAGAVPLGAMFELHIEQGPILEAEKTMIGVVQGVQGMRWFDVTLTGQPSHTGTTPMPLRRNALMGAARLIQDVDAMAKAHAPTAVGTVGFLVVSPNSYNVIPGQVALTVDLRDPDVAVLDAMEAALQVSVTAIRKDFDLEVAVDPVARTAPVVFDAGCIAAVRHAAQKSGYSTRDIVSGAGHDAVHAAAVMPTTMIFVPSAGGLSHNEAESTDQSECAAGAQVLLDAVLHYDARAEAAN